MANYIGNKLCSLRKKRGLSQKDMAETLSKRGVKVTNQAVSKWESGSCLPNAIQFLIICDILDLRDISGFFLGKSTELFDGLNPDGRQRVTEFAGLIRDSGLYDDLSAPEPRGSRLRSLPVYDIEGSSAGRTIAEMTDYTIKDVGNEVPLAANFGVKISGASMEPDYSDGQIVWIKQRPELQHGDVGVFLYDGARYFKRLRDRAGGMRLQSIDSNYPDVIINNSEKIIHLGIAVG